jgi:hypothetical protein
LDFSALGFPAWEFGQRWLRYGKPAQMSQRVLVEFGAQPVTQNKQHTTKSSTRKHAQGGWRLCVPRAGRVCLFARRRRRQKKGHRPALNFCNDAESNLRPSAREIRPLTVEL